MLLRAVISTPTQSESDTSQTDDIITLNSIYCFRLVDNNLLKCNGIIHAVKFNSVQCHPGLNFIFNF